MKRFYNRFSEHLVLQLERNSFIQTTDIPVVRYTLNYLYHVMVYHIILLILGILFGQLHFTVVYILIMGLLKRFTGGAHAPSEHLCSILSYSIFLATMYLDNHLIITSETIIWVILILNTLLTLVLAPVDCRNKRFDLHQRKRLKHITTIIIAVVSVILGILLNHNEYFTVNIILTCLSINSVNLLVGFALNKKEIRDASEHSHLR